MELKIEKPIFIAVITNKFLLNSIRFLKICEAVEEANVTATLANRSNEIKPMYAIIKNGLDWHEFEKFSWRHVFFFDDEKGFDMAWDKMQGDVKWWKLLTELTKR